MILFHGKEIDLFSLIIDLARFFGASIFWRVHPAVSCGDFCRYFLYREFPFFLFIKTGDVLMKVINTQKLKIKQAHFIVILINKKSFSAHSTGSKGVPPLQK
jgi:hypothetical protein